MMQIERLAAQLRNAEKSRCAIPPLTQADKTLTIHDAYKIQMLNVADRLENGERISGKKIGLTSVAMQELLGVNEPDYGHLFNTMDFSADGKIPFSALLQPKIEGEIAFILKKDLIGPGLTVEDVLDATDYIVPALEIVDSRVRDWKIKLIDTVADNASSGCYILGNQKTEIGNLDLRPVKMSLVINGEIVNSGTGADVLGDPAVAVCWLANKLSEYGVTLKKGEVILSGAVTAAPPVFKGAKVEARFSDIGSVAVEFV